MTKFDRYVHSQLLILFGFFALILVSVFWISRAVSLFEDLIADGQTALVFLEFTALGLPTLIRQVVPVAGFVASVYLTNRLLSESELTVMSATGSSPIRLARPFVVFGLVVALFMSLLMHVLAPLANGQLALRQADVATNVSAGLLNEGEFLHPARGVTFFTREIESGGTLRGVFLSDQRRSGETVTYMADKAYLLRGRESTSLILVDGLSERLELETNRLSTARFEDLTYDISSLTAAGGGGAPSLNALTTPRLLSARADVGDSEAAAYEHGEYAIALHERFAQPLFCIVAVLFGFTILIVARHARTGVWREVILAFVLLILLEVLRNTVTAQVDIGRAPWQVLYLPAVSGLLLVAAILGWTSRPRRGRSVQEAAP